MFSVCELIAGDTASLQVGLDVVGAKQYVLQLEQFKSVMDRWGSPALRQVGF